MKGRIFKMFYTLTMGKSFYTFFFPSLPDTFSVPKPRLSHVRVLLPLSISQLSHSQGHSPLISAHLTQPISHRWPPTNWRQPPSPVLPNSLRLFLPQTHLLFSLASPLRPINKLRRSWVFGCYPISPPLG